MGVGDPDGGIVERDFRTAAGVFAWSDEGRCQGYKYGMLDELTQNGNNLFEAVRVMAIVAILLCVMMVCWTLLMTTLSMQRWELWAQRLVFVVLALLVVLSLPLTLLSSLCSEEVGDRSDVSCTLDQGGLVAIAATTLWLVGLMISSTFVKMPGSGDLILVDGELRSEFEERQNIRKRKVASKALQQGRTEDEHALARQGRDLEYQVEDHGNVAVTAAALAASTAAAVAASRVATGEYQEEEEQASSYYRQEDEQASSYTRQEEEQYSIYEGDSVVPETYSRAEQGMHDDMYLPRTPEVSDLMHESYSEFVLVPEIRVPAEQSMNHDIYLPRTPDVSDLMHESHSEFEVEPKTEFMFCNLCD